MYGIPDKVPVTEDFKLNAINPYGRTKLFQEEMFRCDSLRITRGISPDVSPGVRVKGGSTVTVTDNPSDAASTLIHGPSSAACNAVWTHSVRCLS